MTFDPNKTGRFEPYQPESKTFTIILAIILMLALVGMLVYAIRL